MKKLLFFKYGLSDKAKYSRIWRMGGRKYDIIGIRSYTRFNSGFLIILK